MKRYKPYPAEEKPSSAHVPHPHLGLWGLERAVCDPKESGPLCSLASLSSFPRDTHGAGPKPQPFGNYAYVCHLLLLFCLQSA